MILLGEGESEGYRSMMYMDDDALLQMAIERSLQDDANSGSTDENGLSSDQVTLYEALGHSGARRYPLETHNRYVDYDLQRYD